MIIMKSSGEEACRPESASGGERVRRAGTPGGGRSASIGTSSGGSRLPWGGDAHGFGKRFHEVSGGTGDARRCFDAELGFVMTEHRETGAGWTLLRADCDAAMRSIDAGSVDLVYADPPFATNLVQRGRSVDQAYDDRWTGMPEYLDFMTARIEGMHRVLAADGAILLHCDWRTSHHLRFVLDRVFGPDRFVNHLVWRYGLGGSSPNRFARKHDDILYYARGEDRWFEPPMVPATSRRMAGQLKKATDVLDVPSINNMAAERTGWPTQKPLALLRMLVRACLRPGGTLLDPFCGSGTSLVAAVEGGRRAIGVDRDPAAIRISRDRLADVGGD